MSIGVEARAEECGEYTTEKGVIYTRKKIYSPPLTYNYKERELSEDLNGGMECFLREYWRYLKKYKDPLPPRNNVVEFDVWNNSKELEKNLKLQVSHSDLQEKVKEAVKEY